MVHNSSLRRPISAPSSAINHNQSPTSLRRLTIARLRNDSVTAAANGIHSQAPVALETSTTQRAWPRLVPQVSQHPVHMSHFLSQPQGAEHVSEQTDEARPEQPITQPLEPSRQPVQPPSKQPIQRHQPSVARSDEARNRQRKVFSPARNPFTFTPASRLITAETSETSKGAPAPRRGAVLHRRRRRGGTATATRTKTNPTTGWRLELVASDSIISESEFLDSYVTQRVRLFMISALQRLNLELDVRDMSKGRTDVLVLFIDEVLQSCRKWLNEFVRLRGIDGMDISMSDMYKYLAAFLYSHCTGFSMKKVVSLPGADGGWAISKVIVNFIHGNILAYSPTGRGFDSSFTWNPQRYAAIHLSEFKRKSFRMSPKVYLNPNHPYENLKKSYRCQFGAIQMHARKYQNFRQNIRNHT